MTWDAWLSLLLTVAMIIAMIRNMASPDMILLAGLALLMACGVLTPEEAFSGFSNTGMLTIAVMFVVSKGVEQTGGLDTLITRALGQPKSIAMAQLRMMLPVATLSAFLNNTPIVAMLIPIVNDWSKRIRVSPSQLLIPLSFAAIVGGTCSLIGTATNLVVLGMAQQHVPHLSVGMFEVALVGMPVALTTIIYTALTSRLLLPHRDVHSDDVDAQAREYTVAMRVSPSSPLIGQTIEEAGLRHLPGLFLIEIERGGEIRPAPAPTMRVQEADLLIFAGILESVVDLQKIRGLVPAEETGSSTGPRPPRRLVEAVVSTQSELLHRSVRGSRFRTRYGAAIIAVRRQGHRIRAKVGDIVPRVGDTLLLATNPGFAEAYRNDPNFALISEVKNSERRRHERSGLALVLLISMVALSATGLVPLLTAAMAVAGLMIVTRCLTGAQARAAVDLHVLLTIAAAFGVGEALDKTGAASVIADLVVRGSSPFGSWGLLLAIYGTTVVLSAVLTNSAAASLMFPVTFATTQAAGLDFKPFMYCLMMGASASFATPIGYQTNLMVYGPGRYQFSDFTRFGLPLQLLVGVITVIVARFVWM